MKIKEPELTYEQKQAVLNALIARATGGDTIALVHLSKTFLKTEKLQIEAGPLLPQYSREQLIDLLRDYETVEATVIQHDPPDTNSQQQTPNNQQSTPRLEKSFRSEGTEYVKTPHGNRPPAGRRTPMGPEIAFSSITLGQGPTDHTVAPVIQSCFERDQSIIKDAQTKLLTSNSREEIDALCARIALAQSRSNGVPATHTLVGDTEPLRRSERL